MHAKTVVFSAAALLSIVATLFAATPSGPSTAPATGTGPAATGRGPAATGRGRGAGGARGGAPAPQNQTPNAAEVARVDAVLPDKAPATPAKPRKVLAFGKATAFVHATIPLGLKTIELLGSKTHAYETTTTFDPAIFDAEKLKDFDAIALVSTTGKFLDDANDAVLTAKRRKALLDFVNDGKGLVGIHAASDAYYDWPEYGMLMGGYFSRHTSAFEKILVKLDDVANPINAPFEGKSFETADEIYRFVTPTSNRSAKQTFSRDHVRVLMSVDVSKYNNEPAGTDMPISWVHAQGKGRVFYCSLAHNASVFATPALLKHYLAGMQYAIGDLKVDDAPAPTSPIAEH